MLKQTALTILLLCAALGYPALAEERYSVEETKIGVLMEDPEARAILEKYLPQTTSDGQWGMANMFTLRFIQPHDGYGELTDENLEKIDAELAEISAGDQE